MARFTIALLLLNELMKVISKKHSMKSNEKDWWTIRHRLEAKPEIKEYLQWQSLPSDVKALRRQRWDNYYIAVRQRPSYDRLRRMSVAFKTGNKKDMDEILEENRIEMEEGDYLATPEGRDPTEYNRGIYEQYRKVVAMCENQGQTADGMLHDIFG